MKISKFFGPAVLAVVLAFATTSCATFRKPPAAARPISYALVVSVDNGQPPTEAQWTQLQKQFATMLAARGFALVSDPALADRVIHVRYVPDIIYPDDPTQGHAVIISVKDNVSAIAGNAFASKSASYTNYSSSLYDAFYESSNFYTPTNDVYVPGAVHPPPSHSTPPPHSTKPDDCPPVNFTGNYPVHIITPNPGDGHHTVHPHSEPGYSRSDSSYSRSDSSYSSSSSSSARDSSSSFSTSLSPASSYSAPSYSPPSPSSDSSSSFSSSSGASSAPSYSPPADSPSNHDVQPR